MCVWSRVLFFCNDFCPERLAAGGGGTREQGQVQQHQEEEEEEDKAIFGGRKRSEYSFTVFFPEKVAAKLFFGPLCCSLCRQTLRNSPKSCNGIHAHAYAGSGEGEKPELGIVSLFVCLHAHNTFSCECVYAAAIIPISPPAVRRSGNEGSLAAEQQMRYLQFIFLFFS